MKVLPGCFSSLSSPSVRFDPLHRILQFPACRSQHEDVINIADVEQAECLQAHVQVVQKESPEHWAQKGTPMVYRASNSQNNPPRSAVGPGRLPAWTRLIYCEERVQGDPRGPGGPPHQKLQAGLYS
jgi:hypothetical protein